jgi:uncharacterized membrane protein SpoIIM required for sporulation
MSKKTRAIFFGIFVGVFLVSYLVGVAYKMSDEDAKNLLQDFQSVTQGIDMFGIFSHNLTDALPMFVPGFGIAWGAYTAWSTGAAFNALLSQNHLLSRISPIEIFLVSPFGIMELAAYSIGMSRSLILIFSLVKRRTLKHELKITGIEIGIAVGLLLVAAIIESYMVLHH